jgi:hypothetical protein
MRMAAAMEIHAPVSVASVRSLCCFVSVVLALERRRGKGERGESERGHKAGEGRRGEERELRPSGRRPSPGQPLVKVDGLEPRRHAARQPHPMWRLLVLVCRRARTERERERGVGFFLLLSPPPHTPLWLCPPPPRSRGRRARLRGRVCCPSALSLARGALLSKKFLSWVRLASVWFRVVVVVAIGCGSLGGMTVVSSACVELVEEKMRRKGRRERRRLLMARARKASVGGGGGVPSRRWFDRSRSTNAVRVLHQTWMTSLPPSAHTY